MPPEFSPDIDSGAALRASEAALREVEARQRLLIDALPALISYIGADERYRLANRAYSEWFGVPRESVVGNTVREVLGDQTYAHREPFLRRALAGETVRFEGPTSDSRTGDRRISEVSYVPDIGPDGAVRGFFVLVNDITERKDLERERERLLDEQRRLLREAQARAERAAILNRVNTVLRASLDPDEIERSAVTILGESLGADRCYLVSFRPAEDRSFITAEYRRRGDLPPMAGRYVTSSYRGVMADLYRSPEAQVIDDIRDPRSGLDPATVEQMTALRMRAFVRVPLYERGVLVGTLALGMADDARRWTPEEVDLLKSAAAQVRAVAEAARVQRREHNIAEQLQEALQPPAPSDLSGLTLATYYRAALEEAGVGGDFFDAFDLDDGRACLVVADLSGKGLAAAAQVATLRSMLRYAVYAADTVRPGALAAALDGLHRTLVRRDLLTGFATLCVAVWDAGAETLTYVNAGQEPGLIRRADGRIDRLPPTGPVLGGFEGETYREESVALAPGDVLALFTDGLTEVGPDRRTLLEIAGVEELLQGRCAEAAGRDPRGIADAGTVLGGLIAGIDAYGRGGAARDDIALLVAVRTTETYAPTMIPSLPAVPEISPSPRAAERDLLAAIADSSVDAVFAKDADGRYLFANGAVARAVGRPLGEIIGRYDADFLPPETARAVRENDRLVMETGVPLTTEETVADGEGPRQYVATKSPLRDPATGAIVGIVAVSRDVTETRRAERERALADERFRALADNIAQLAWMADPSGAIFWYNRRWYEYTGTTPEQMLGWGWRAVHDPEHLKRMEPRFRAAIAAGEPWEDTFPLRGADGQYRWFLSRAFPTRDASGAITLWCGTNTDITAQREAQAIQRRFVREMLFSTTEGRLRLCETEADLPAPLPESSGPIELTRPTIRLLRRAADELTQTVGLPDDRAQDFITAVGEGAMNAVVHAGGGIGEARADRDRGVVQVWVRDTGAGIAEDALHRATLEKGFSSAGTLGHGFHMMLRTADRVYLLTGPGGTTVVIEQEREPPAPAWLQSARAG